MAFRDTSIALFCSDQILEGQYLENIPRLFLSKGQESSVRCILQNRAGALHPGERVRLPPDADSEETKCPSPELAKLSPTSPVDYGYTSEKGFEDCQSVAARRGVMWKSADDLERLLSVRH